MPQEIYFELIRQGNSVRVAAIDQGSGTEAVVVVPASLPIEAAKQQALNKLIHLLDKKKSS